MTDEARLQRWLNGQRRSHQRTFQSRELVWSSFETIARDSATAIDQLIAEAMEAYAEQRGYRIPEEPAEESKDAWAASPYMQDMDEARDPLEETRDAPEGLTDLDRAYDRGPPAPAQAPRRPPPSFNASAGWDDDNDLARTETRDAVKRPLPGLPPLPGRGAMLDIKEPGEESRTTPRYRSSPSAPTNVSPATMPAAINRPVPTPAAGSLVSRGTRPLQPPGQGPMSSQPGTGPRATFDRNDRTMERPTAMERAGAPPPLRQSSEAPLRDTGSNPAMKRLLLSNNGRQVEVDKERFVLGRSKTQADLRLEDPNVSRQHAAIERVGAAWYVVDLGSTNGITVNGQRVTRHALRDGDLIVITSQEIRCSLR